MNTATRGPKTSSAVTEGKMNRTYFAKGFCVMVVSRGITHVVRTMKTVAAAKSMAHRLNTLAPR